MINSTTLYNAMLRYGIPLRNVRPRRKSAEREQMMRRMFLTEKFSLQVIADRMGRSLGQARKSLQFLRDDDGAPDALADETLNRTARRFEEEE